MLAVNIFFKKFPEIIIASKCLFNILTLEIHSLGYIGKWFKGNPAKLECPISVCFVISICFARDMFVIKLSTSNS